MNDTNAHLVESYFTGGDRLAAVVKGWSDSDLRRLPSASAPADVGKWSAHQIVIHLQDAEVSFADRLRRVIAMEEPMLLKWDENAFTRRLYYEDHSSADAKAIILLTRLQTGRVLRKLSDTDFERIGIHSERGPQKLSDIIHFADWHLNHHLAFIEKKRAAFKI